MPNLAANHPQVVHFAIVLVFIGVAFRCIALTGKFKFTNHAATVLIVLSAIAAAVSVKSGDDAHGPVERIPGVRQAVIEHEDLGVQVRNVLIGVAFLELLALGLAGRSSLSRYAKFAYFGSAAVGLVAVAMMYETAEHGGELVYSYAGGPGLRTGDAKDVERLLLAGLYNQSVADRKAGRPAEAARLVNEMALRFPDDTTVKFLHVESLLLDTKDYPAALAAAQTVVIPMDSLNGRFLARKTTLVADIYLAMGYADSARAVLAPVVEVLPRNTRLKAKLDSIR